MKTTKGGKVMNPTDAYRKELRKKELKRNKKERKKVREVGILKKDPEAIKEQIRKLEMMKADGALDKTRRHKKRQLEDTLNLVIKKRKEYEDKMREKGEEPVMFRLSRRPVGKNLNLVNHLPAPRRRATAEEEERAKHPKPEDSVYFHPSLNPSGAPPPGKPPMYKSAIGPRIPLSAAGASSASEVQQTGPMPRPPPLPADGEGTSTVGDPVIPLPVPVPPPPPVPLYPDSESVLPLASLPPPPPGPPPAGTGQRVSVSLPPLPARFPQPPPPGTIQEGSIVGVPHDAAEDSDTNRTENFAVIISEDLAQGQPPSQRHRPPQALVQEDEIVESTVMHSQGLGLCLPSPPPLRPPSQQPARSLPVLIRPPSCRPPQVTSGEDLPPGVAVAGLPPPPPVPTDMRLPMSLPGPPPLQQRMPPAGMAPPPGAPPGLPSRSHTGPLPGPPRMRPPAGPPPVRSNDSAGPPLGLPPPPTRSSDRTGVEDANRAGTSRPSYVKSAAATVIKRPLAQHTPELTSMVPASVRVRRENRNKVKPKPAINSAPARASATPEPDPVPRAVKPQSIDDSYYAFLEDMKALGAFDEGEKSY